ncbi:uroporphyrinogen-III C-methyltransferase [Isoalcanivorax indicus]|uniref:uroporphyrinogen-III C-methyltransferase n=1 Tax=Isoalcanivorax indicus TaxID=2202653 RepID=UPI0013C48FB3|nr:uroporphyrinogen-III C-methyltransferase [Isoalcanivorax indicus]
MSGKEEGVTDTPPASPVPPRGHRRPPAGRGRGLLWLILVLMLAGAGYLGWQVWESQHREHGAWRAALADQEDHWQRALATTQDAQAAQAERIQQLETALADTGQQLRALREGGQQFWLISEALSLASLAEQQLLLTGDAEAAARVLHAADDLLARSDDNAMLPLREALREDIARLNAAQRVDVTGILLELGALQGRVADLALPRREPPSAGTADAEETDAAETGRLERLLARLPVRIRTYDGPAPLPLDSASRQLVRLALENELQQARLALLQGRPDVYTAALQRADELAGTWFAQADPGVEAFREAVQTLAAQDVAQALPDIGTGLAALRRARAGRMPEGDE